MKRTALFVTALALGLALAAPSAASADLQGRGSGRGQAAKSDKASKKHEKHDAKAAKPAKPAKPAKAAKSAKAAKRSDTDDAAVVVVDRDRHARVIRESRGTGSLPPGLAKRRSLPPGLRRQLVERGTLPPGLQGYVVAVPDPWEARLPPIPSYYHRYFAGDDLIVVDTRTNRIAAIVRDVLR